VTGQMNRPIARVETADGAVALNVYEHFLVCVAARRPGLVRDRPTVAGERLISALLREWPEGDSAASRELALAVAQAREGRAK
jgi:hypothetical protein